MNKMDILLQQLGIHEKSNQLKELEMKKVVVSKKDVYHFYFEGEEILSFDEFSLFERKLKEFPFPTLFTITYRSKQYEINQVLQYISYFKEVFTNHNSSMQFINQLKFDYVDDTVLFYAINEIQLHSLLTFEKFMSDSLLSVGIDVYVKSSIDEENQEYMQIKETMELDNYEAKNFVDVRNTETYTKKQKKNFYSKNNNEYSKVRLNELNQNTPKVKISGYVFKSEIKKFKSGRSLQTLHLTDYTDSIVVKRFERGKVDINELEKISANLWVEITGDLQHDSFMRELVIMANEVTIIDDGLKRVDSAPLKRVELHTHTKMSTMDGISTISDYIEAAARWGHKAIALCDHGNVQSFPEAQAASKKNKIKMIYGVEMNVVDPILKIVSNPRDIPLVDTTYVSFDLETTGLSVIHDKITEFGAVKIKNGEVIDKFQTFVNPEMVIPTRIVNLTGITNEMVNDALTIKELLPKILEFFGEDVLVAHNANFDIGFLNYALKNNGFSSLDNTVIDTLNLGRAILKPMKSYRLGSIARNYKVAYDEEIAHRADYDAEVLGHILNRMLHDLMDKKIYSIKDIDIVQRQNLSYRQVFPYHVTLLAKNKKGLKNMFKLVSEANTTFYAEQSRIPREMIQQYRDGLLIGSSCYRSEAFEAAMNLDDTALEKSLEFYDYIEIQPLEDYYHLVDRGSVASEETLKKSVIRLIDKAEEMGKIIVGTGDVHFLNPEDKIYRDVFISNPTIGINHSIHPLCNRRNPKAWTPYQYFRTTNEFLDTFSFLNEQKAYEYVVTNTNKIADMIEEFEVVHNELYTPSIEGADQRLTEICYQTAYQTYGRTLPTIVEERLDKELKNIIKHGFGVIYYIAHKLVKKSNEEGYMVGSRGSVGSSFVATMSGITEVNPLQPHYRCPHCTHSEFLETRNVVNGFDLPTKKCPKCGENMLGDGHNIPFETFLGFDADKVPDIDLNFSGEYQWKAHEYTKEIFGEDKVYRAGTISTVADKTAYGYAKGYKELMGTLESTRSAELERIANGCTGVKRTTGQHPGGIIVIPNDMDVYDFTPVQYPADDLTAPWKTTHFDFHAIHDNVLKLDILGHVDPTVIRMLQDLTGVDPKSIPMNDEKVISLFSSTEALNIDLSYINCKTGALGLPEFGTNFVRQMLEQTMPKSFSDLVIISGLSHGTDVYLGNAELLIKSGAKKLSEVIGCRDDIMVYLTAHGVEPLTSFKIMEFVRKGLPAKLKDTWQEWVAVLKENQIEGWYIDSLEKIKYMFPKAHAVAYVMSSVRVAWWKLYYPAEYYAVYYTTRCDSYDIETMIKGKDAILLKRQQIEELRSQKQASKKDEDLYLLFDICLEMFDRGYYFSNIDLNRSASTTFVVDKNNPKCIIPPFTSLDGLGDSVAESIISARKEYDFISKEDVINRTRLNNTHIKQLTKMNVFAHLQDENQLSLFSFM